MASEEGWVVRFHYLAEVEAVACPWGTSEVEVEETLVLERRSSFVESESVGVSTADLSREERVV